MIIKQEIKQIHLYYKLNKNKAIKRDTIKNIKLYTMTIVCTIKFQ
jgi:hypothetical protein